MRGEKKNLANNSKGWRPREGERKSGEVFFSREFSATLSISLSTEEQKKGLACKRCGKKVIKGERSIDAPKQKVRNDKRTDGLIRLRSNSCP